jgi:AraC-like DNA-binding protein
MPIEVVHRGSDSPYVSRVWRGRVSGEERMTSVASSTWEIVFWTDGGVTHAGVRGPETAASTAEIVGDSDSLGITFAHGTSLAPLPAGRLVDAQWDSPRATARSFVLDGEEWEIPAIDDAEMLVGRLVRRRVSATTGLTQGAIRQIERARLAALLLEEGVPALDVVTQCGYYDQPHLARSLKRFIGRTATQLQQADAASDPLSFLYKPEAGFDS